MSTSWWPRGARGMRTVAGALMLAAFGGLASAAVASATDALADSWVIVDPASPASVTFEEGVAELSVVVLNDSDTAKRPTVAIQDAATGTSLIGASGGFEATVTAPVIAARAVGTVEIIIERAGDATADLDAVLVISSPLANSGTLRLSAAEAPDALANARIAPASVTINATRCWPWILGPQDCWFDELDVAERVPYLHRPWAVVHPDGLPADFGSPGAFLSSDRGGEMFVRLVPPDAASGSHWLVRLGAADAAGEYTGTLSLDAAAEEAPSLSITVNVQDFVAWPLAVMLLGVWVAWELTKRRDVERPKRLLVHHLMRIGETYFKLRRVGCPTPADRAWLAGAFVEGEGPMDLKADRDTVADRLYAAIRTASTASTVKELELKVADVEELVGTWERLCETATSLRAQLEAHRQIDPDAGVFALADQLLAPRDEPLATAEAANDLLSQLKDQRAAIELLVASRVPYNAAVGVWNRLTPDERVGKQDPDAFWQAEVRPRRTKGEFVQRGTLATLEELHRELLEVLKARPPLEGREGLADGTLATLAREADEFSAARMVAAIDAMFPPTEPRTATAILEDVQKLDKWEFLVTGLVTVLVFLQTSYVDKNFGTEWQYLAMFLAALGGTVAINWKLLPWYREYRLSKV